MATDPAFVERERERAREYARKRWREDPEWRVHRAAIVKAYRDRLRIEQPERWRRWLEDQRMANRLRAEQRGHPIPPVPEKVYARHYGNGYGKTDLLPVEPLRRLIGLAVDADLTLNGLAVQARVSERRLRDLMTIQHSVSLRNADKICTTLGVPLTLVYPEAP